jgi:2-hydroxy-3-keto-5-methylthiopentenyl-1-phosphate phosphatase
MEKTLVQCDFDGTVTYKDISFMLLDAFVGFEWREYLDRYQEGKITVGEFSRRTFRMVKATREEMLSFMKNRVRMRPGFKQFVQLCKDKNYRLVIVSNGFDFYIGDILKRLGSGHIEYHAAEAIFRPEGLDLRYTNPEGKEIDADFKLSYMQKFLGDGYRVIYVGDGNSDFDPARRCYRVFATDSLLRRCQYRNIPCIPFNDFFDIIKVMEKWE